MVTREESLQRFLSKADEVVEGKYLLAIKKIEEMLLEIRKSRILFEVFEFCNSGEPINKLKAKYFVEGENGREGAFIMPENQKQFIAISFTTLKNIAEGVTDFTVFLKTYFPAGDGVLDCYHKFINLFMIPFKKSVKNMVETLISASKIKENRIQLEINKPHLDILYLKGVAELLEDDRRAVVNSGMKDSVTSDLLCVIDALIECARNAEVDKLRPLFIGYKYAVMHLKKGVKTNYEEVEEFLTDHGIIKD